MSKIKYHLVFQKMFFEFNKLWDLMNIFSDITFYGDIFLVHKKHLHEKVTYKDFKRTVKKLIKSLKKIFFFNLKN